MADFVTIRGKPYRYGHTTGSCAAAAARAATEMLFGGQDLAVVRISTPAGKLLDLPLEAIRRGEGKVSCAVRKDGGDDPDVTTGLLVHALAEHFADPGLQLVAGEGIGRVTRAGLKVAIGEPAINPVPLAMIRQEVAAALPAGQGVRITLWIPGGEEVAKKTFNPRLGVVGGLSILGTTGLVKPMSEEAWKDALALELRVLAQSGARQAVFAFGNYGERFAASRCGLDWATITMGNFVGFMLEAAVEQGFGRILLVGHIGKLIKVAAGIFHTHSRVADARLETLVAYAALGGADRATCQEIMASATTDAACAIIEERGLAGIYQEICAAASLRCRQHVADALEIGTVLYRGSDVFLAADSAAGAMLGGNPGGLAT